MSLENRTTGSSVGGSPSVEGTEVEPRLEVDTSRWPLVVLWYEGEASDEQINRHLREIEERVLARRQTFVQIIEQSRGVMPNAIQRQAIARHQDQNDELYRKYCIGEAYVTNPKWRGAMIAIFWSAKPSYPYCFVDTFDEAIRWAQARVKSAEEGIVVSPR